MPLIHDRCAARSVIETVADRGAALPIFCTGSHWNTEAILLAAKRIGEKYQLETVPVAVAITFNYRHMPQARRFTRTDSAKLGFLSCMSYLRVLCETPDSPYRSVTVLPHLDHADPGVDEWALTEGSEFLASAMFDAQNYPAQQNIAMTAEYVKNYGRKLLVEGILESLPVAGGHAAASPRRQSAAEYAAYAAKYAAATGVDFLVADLGTEQQSAGTTARYDRERAAAITAALGGKARLVLHGASSLSEDEFSALPGDGVVRVNMWTRIARESGQFAAGELFRRAPELFHGDFEAAESHRYLMDNIDRAADMMVEIMEKLHYANLASRQPRRE